MCVSISKRAALLSPIFSSSRCAIVKCPLSVAVLSESHESLSSSFSLVESVRPNCLVDCSDDTVSVERKEKGDGREGSALDTDDWPISRTKRRKGNEGRKLKPKPKMRRTRDK